MTSTRKANGLSARRQRDGVGTGDRCVIAALRVEIRLLSSERG